MDLQPSTPDRVIVTDHERVRTVVINRPDARNAVDRQTAELLSEAFAEFDADPNSDVAVLTGAGGNFCSGADLKSFAEGNGNRLEATGDGPMGPTRMQLSKPVIAAVCGYAVAGGLELALWCDLRVVEQSATFGVFCRRWGVPLIDGGTVRLPRTVGFGVAMDMTLTGRPVGAHEALQIGLANRLVDDGTALAQAQQLASELSGLPQTCLRNDRLSMYEAWGQPSEAALASEWKWGLKSLTADARDSATRFAGGSGRGGSQVL